VKPLLFIGGPLDGKRFRTYAQTVDVNGYDGEYTKQSLKLVKQFRDLETNELNAVEIWTGRVMVWNFPTEGKNIKIDFDTLSVNDYEIETIDGDALRLYWQDIA